MLKNYFLTAFRVFSRQSLYSIINVLGLTVGVASSLFIMLYLVDELGYDRFHPDAEQIHRVTFQGRLQGQEFTTVLVGMPLKEALRGEIPEVMDAVRFVKWSTHPVRYEEKAFTENQFLLADSNFFTFFHFKLIAGNPVEVLKGPNKVVISERAAQKYFGYQGRGDNSPLGKILILGSKGERTAVVSGIAENPPGQSHFHFDFILSMESWEYATNPIWLNSSVLTYFKTLPGVSTVNVQKRLTGFVKKYCEKELFQYLNLSFEEFERQGGHLGFGVQPLLDIHLYSDLQDELEPNGKIAYVYLFTAVTLFILLLACINFMNLATARSASRAREIGVRKSVGALKSGLMGQFLMESFFYTILSFLFAFILVYSLMGPFNLLSGKEFVPSMFLQPIFLVGLPLFIIFIGLMAGSYPAFYLTSFKPVEVLKGKVRAGSGSFKIRNGLVIFQFFISIGLIIASVLIYQQLLFLQQKNLGFEKENIINVLHTVNLGTNGEVLKNELLKYPEVVACSFANRLPPNIDWTSTFITEGDEKTYLLAIYTMDYDHIKTLGYTMKSGRFFSRDFPSDSSAVILNETAARQMGFEAFQGKKIKSYFDSEKGRWLEVVGIMKDFNFETLKSAVRPMAVLLGPSPNYEMAIRIQAGDVGETINRIGGIWKKYAPEVAFEYSFLDENFDALFRAEQRLSHVILLFTCLAVFIACLGLFGLATFMAEQRSKEIGIRKILGASNSQVVELLSRNFLKLVMVAFALSIPLVWIGMSKWLEEFAYRIEIQGWVFLVSGMVALVIAFLTTSYQALRAAGTNPVEALRSE